jgi:hypothetical protein
MLARLIGEGTVAAQLKGGLDDSTRAVRGIAHRVANASTPGGPGTPDFAVALEAAVDPDGRPVDLEREMVSLADEQLRYETATNLLQKIYQQIRQSVSER